MDSPSVHKFISEGRKTCEAGAETNVVFLDHLFLVVLVTLVFLVAFCCPPDSSHLYKFSLQAHGMIVRKPTEMGPDHLDKSKREKCFTSRDEYWKCLDSNNDNEEACKQLRQVLESTCPSLWVSNVFMVE